MTTQIKPVRAWAAMPKGATEIIPPAIYSYETIARSNSDTEPLEVIIRTLEDDKARSDALRVLKELCAARLTTEEWAMLNAAKEVDPTDLPPLLVERGRALAIAEKAESEAL